MRFPWLVGCSLLTVAAFAACSSSSTTTDPGTGTGTGTDAGNGGSKTDAGSGGGSTDAGSGGNTDSGSGSKTDSGGVITGNCSLPGDCTTAGDVCCSTIPLTGGTIPNCTNGTVVNACKAPASCPTKIVATCTGTQTVRLCSKNTDCAAEPTDNLCCTFGNDGGALSFCANAIVALGGGTCM